MERSPDNQGHPTTSGTTLPAGIRPPMLQAGIPGLIGTPLTDAKATTPTKKILKDAAKKSSLDANSDTSSTYSDDSDDAYSQTSANSEPSSVSTATSSSDRIAFESIPRKNTRPTETPEMRRRSELFKTLEGEKSISDDSMSDHGLGFAAESGDLFDDDAPETTALGKRLQEAIEQALVGFTPTEQKLGMLGLLETYKKTQPREWIEQVFATLEIPENLLPNVASMPEAQCSSYAAALENFIQKTVATPINAQRFTELSDAFEKMSENGQDESTNIPKRKNSLWNKVGEKLGANASSTMQGTQSLTDDEWRKIKTDIAKHLNQEGYTTNNTSNDDIKFSKKSQPPLEDLSVQVQRHKGKLRMLSNLTPIELAAAWAVTGQSPLTISKASPDNAKAILKAFEDNHPTFSVLISDAVLQSMDAQGQAAYEAHKAKLPAAKSSPTAAQSTSPSTPRSTSTSNNPKPAASPLPSSDAGTPNTSPDGNASDTPRKSPRM